LAVDRPQRFFYSRKEQANQDGLQYGAGNALIAVMFRSACRTENKRAWNVKSISPSASSDRRACPGGTCGYMFIEGWAFDDAFYMTIITLATVGYGEVHQISDAGRIFTIILIVSGVGYFMYVVGLIVQFLVEDRIRVILGRRKLDKQIAKLKDHYIVCGYGRIGRVLVRYLTERYLNVVVIEKNADRQAAMDEDGVLYLVGEATDESLLLRAGIRSAKG
jgi:voltage-gated potassium channel